MVSLGRDSIARNECDVCQLLHSGSVDGDPAPECDGPCRLRRCPPTPVHRRTSDGYLTEKVEDAVTSATAMGGGDPRRDREHGDDRAERRLLVTLNNRLAAELVADSSPVTRLHGRTLNDRYRTTGTYQRRRKTCSPILPEVGNSNGRLLRPDSGWPRARGKLREILHAPIDVSLLP